MKKGLVTLTVLALLLVGVTAFADVPVMWGIPDIIIGDAEDQAVTDNLFVFDDAFTFADYYGWLTSGGARNLKWHYFNCDPPGLIAINGMDFDEDSIADISAGFATASFRNIALSPVGGPYSLNPVGWVGTTDIAAVSLSVDNALIIDDQDVFVFTVDSGNDALTNEYYQQPLTSYDASSPIGTWSFFALNAGPDVVPPFGMVAATGEYNSTSGAYTISTTGSDNNFGWWQTGQTEIDYVDGAAYIVTASLFATPTFPEGANRNLYIPQMRIRMNTSAEAVSAELDMFSNGTADAEVTSDSTNPTTEAFVMFPRDQAKFEAVNLAALYFNFDMLDYAASNRAYPAELDDEGTVGITGITIDTFPMKMLPREATLQEAYPNADSFADELGRYASAQTGFGGTPVRASTDTFGNLAITSVNVTRGFALWTQVSAFEQIDFTNDGAGAWYVWQFICTSSNQSGDWLRFRAFTADGQRSSNLNIRRTGGGDGYQYPGMGGSTYHVFLAPPPALDGDNMGFGFDYIDFDPDGGNIELSLWAVSCFSATPPTAVP